ncbi:hypothetical protein KP509_21G016400 [Ceratopteris richardii]|nr:hypothetical protein KP509_21G016400 [Ceratopteris richardii]
MPYLYSVVKEVLRLHPVVPLLLPRISSEECKIEDYILPKETMAFVNVWAIGRDPKIWDRPEDFYPERFEMRETDMKGQDYELLPFGSGRRMCVGIRLGISMVSVTLANLIRFFDWELPPNQSASSINMSEQNGLGSGMACPIKAVPYVRSGFLGSSFL